MAVTLVYMASTYVAMLPKQTLNYTIQQFFCVFTQFPLHLLSIKTLNSLKEGIRIVSTFVVADCKQYFSHTR
jgi:hypothetical protein